MLHDSEEVDSPCAVCRLRVVKAEIELIERERELVVSNLLVQHLDPNVAINIVRVLRGERSVKNREIIINRR